MSSNLDSAKQFFEACETGKGWETCNVFCHSEATFSSQTAVLADIATLEDYCEWMKNLLTPIPDGHYELKFFAADDARNSVAAFAVFHGTQTGEGGPVPPTGNTIAADYVYYMTFDGDRITSMPDVNGNTFDELAGSARDGSDVLIVRMRDYLLRWLAASDLQP